MAASVVRRARGSVETFVVYLLEGGRHGLSAHVTAVYYRAPVVGDTLNIQWKAEADFLAEPYKDSEAF